MPELSFNLKTSVILLDAELKASRGIRRIKMVLDTGASITTIPYETAVAIGIDPTRPKKRIGILTASGKELVPLITIPHLSLMGFTLENIESICLTLPTTNSRPLGLLGLNVLKEFNVFLKFRSGVLVIN